MHTTTAPFALHVWSEGEKFERLTGWQGTSQEFGEITVIHPHRGNDGHSLRSEVRGSRIPSASFSSRGFHAQVMTLPSLNGAMLRLGDSVVYMTRNRWALTHRGRSLRLEYGGDHYRLTAVNRKEYTLTRAPDAEDPGVTIRVKQSGIGKSKRLAVTVLGRALGADITLAALFGGVDRATLTRRGAVRAGISRVFGFYAESQY
ncbi:hypothetical protein ACFYYS_25360 [Streptomyces sp. NPDC002120]|uniref:hypothetical protein n=1 Tax=Streptomyces sp. NPDC002120 TaxID=3364631 RepID=UPI00368FB1F8